MWLIMKADTQRRKLHKFCPNRSKNLRVTCLLYVFEICLGRTTQDAGIDVRRGAMSRSQAVQLVQMYDDIYPEKLFEEYCDYYKMSMKEFQENIDKWANKDLFEKQMDTKI